MEHNRSRFIVGRIFDETFRVVRADPTKQRYLVRLNEYIAQISRVGNNYNQVVKAINTCLSRNMLPRQIDTLVACTRELKALSGASVGADQTIAGGVVERVIGQGGLALRGKMTIFVRVKRFLIPDKRTER